MPLGSACNLSCYFCSNRYNPPGIMVFNIPFLPSDLIKDLIYSLNPQEKIIIGESATRLNEGEPLFHPQFLAIIKELRRAFPKTLIQITTNGILLSPKIQEALSSLNPIELVISFNSLKASKRASLLGDPHPEETIQHFYYLVRSGIKFQASFILALPFLEELPESLKIVEDLGAYYVRLLLPGGSKWAPRDLQGSMEDWLKLKERMLLLRKRVGIPLVIEPPLISGLKTEVEGVIRGSPAEKCGLKAEDVILKINGKEPDSRQEAFKIINQAENPQLEVQRGSQSLEFTIFKKMGEKSGLVFSNDLDVESLRGLSSVIPEKGRGVCLTSELAFKVVSLAFQKHHPQVPVLPVPSLSLGGSIRTLGLLAVQDFRVLLSALKGNGRSFDWVIVNPIFQEDGLDLRGENLQALEKEFSLTLIYPS
ncbi:MAG: PDZ domain-containing protein [Coprothermobacterota bacterium]|nr:PDZ domain-containing protein [Coprothermobacterota bacterium]